MKNIERYKKYNGEKISEDIAKWCKKNTNKYKLGCYYCPIWGECDGKKIKSKKEIKAIMCDSGYPVVWEKHIKDFYKNYNRTSEEIDRERLEERIKEIKCGHYGNG